MYETNVLIPYIDLHAGKEMRKDVAFYEKAKKIRKEKCQSRV
jgi:hypothetical protein